VHELVRALLRYFLAIALGSWQTAPALDDPELLELLRAVKTRETGINERVRLLRLLLRGRKTFEVPELLALVTPGVDGADQLEAFVALGASDYAASEDVARLRLDGLIERLTAVLVACQGLLEYELVLADGWAVESWRGLRPRLAVAMPAELPTGGHPTLVHRDGRPGLDLWPAIQVLPAAGSGLAREMCVFEGRLGESTRMISASGYPVSDHDAKQWITDIVADLENRTRLQEQVRLLARYWDDSGRPSKLLLRRQLMRDVDQLMTTPLLSSEPVRSFIAESLRDARRMMSIVFASLVLVAAIASITTILAVRR
jgi:hypothetical protein